MLGNSHAEWAVWQGKEFSNGVKLWDIPAQNKYGDGFIGDL